MKNWKSAELVVLNFSETANGGKPSMDFDQQWFDQNGALHVNFVKKETTKEQS